jgi:hypothetical protein
MFEEDYFPPGADKEKEKGKDVHFCPPCHEKRNNSISSPFVPPNADLNLLLNGSPDTPGRKRATPKRLAMNDDDTESKEVEDSPYSVDHPPNQHMDTAFLKTIESIDDNNSSIRPLSYEVLQAKTISSLRLIGSLCFYN